MSAMARVWAHPEDAHLYPDAGGAARRRTRGRRTVRLPGDAPPGGAGGAGGGPDGGAGFAPGPGLGSEPGHGAWLPALPLVPLLRVAGLQAEAAQRVSSLPAAPGSLTAGLALAASGAMAWVSPLQARAVPRPWSRALPLLLAGRLCRRSGREAVPQVGRATAPPPA